MATDPTGHWTDETVQQVTDEALRDALQAAGLLREHDRLQYMAWTFLHEGAMTLTPAPEQEPGQWQVWCAHPAAPQGLYRRSGPWSTMLRAVCELRLLMCNPVPEGTPRLPEQGDNYE